MEATYPQTQQLLLVDRDKALSIRSMSPNELGSECIALIHNKGFDSGLYSTAKQTGITRISYTITNKIQLHKG